MTLLPTLNEEKERVVRAQVQRCQSVRWKYQLPLAQGQYDAEPLAAHGLSPVCVLASGGLVSSGCGGERNDLAWRSDQRLLAPESLGTLSACMTFVAGSGKENGNAPQIISCRQGLICTGRVEPLGRILGRHLNWPVIGQSARATVIGCIEFDVRILISALLDATVAGQTHTDVPDGPK